MTSTTSVKTLIALAILVCSSVRADDVASVLAAQPAQSPQQQAELAQRLIALGPEVIAQVASQLVPLGAGDDNAARYALSGLAKEASKDASGEQGAVVADALMKALQSATNAEVQLFLIEQLYFLADKKELAEAAQKLTADPKLQSYADAALVVLGAAPARKVQAAPQQAGNPKVAELQRLAEDNPRRALSACLDAMDSDDAELRAAALQIAEKLEGKRVAKQFERKMKKASPQLQQEIQAMLHRRGNK